MRIVDQGGGAGRRVKTTAEKGEGEVPGGNKRGARTRSSECSGA